MTTTVEPGSRSTSAGPTSRPRTPSGAVRSLPFELWERPDELGRAIARVAEAMPGIGLGSP